MWYASSKHWCKLTHFYSHNSGRGAGVCGQTASRLRRHCPKMLGKKVELVRTTALRPILWEWKYVHQVTLSDTCVCAHHVSAKFVITISINKDLIALNKERL